MSKFQINIKSEIYHHGISLSYIYSLKISNRKIQKTLNIYLQRLKSIVF